MPLRREDLASAAEQIAESRNVIIELVIVAVALGLLVDLCVAGLVVWIGLDSESDNLPWIVATTSVVLIGTLCYWVWTRYRETVTSSTKIDLIIPYVNNDAGGIRVLESDDHPYSVVTDARKLYWSAYGRSRHQELRQEYMDWYKKTERPKRVFRNFFHQYHHQLIDALVFNALALSAEHSLGRSADRRWQNARIVPIEVPVRGLPPHLAGNVFLKAKADAKLRLPPGFVIDIESTDSGWRWSIGHRNYGRVIIDIARSLLEYPLSARAQRVRILYRDLASATDESHYTALSSRLEAWAELNTVISLSKNRRNKADLVHAWMTRLTADIQQALDWEYFFEERLPRQQMFDIYMAIRDLENHCCPKQDRIA